MKKKTLGAIAAAVLGVATVFTTTIYERKARPPFEADDILFYSEKSLRKEGYRNSFTPDSTHMMIVHHAPNGRDFIKERYEIQKDGSFKLKSREFNTWLRSHTDYF